MCISDWSSDVFSSVLGPAAGLAVIVFEIVQKQGLSALGPILILAGAIPVVAGLMRVGGWFRAISPAVVHGMLAGIGVLIVVGQFHVLDRTSVVAGKGWSVRLDLGGGRCVTTKL